MKAFFPKQASQSHRTRDERAGAHLFKVSLSSIKRVTLGWSFSSSTQGKDNGGVEVTKVVLLYRTDLSYGVKTQPMARPAQRIVEAA